MDTEKSDNWDKVDPVKLAADAERKEAKRVRQLELRAKRAEDRKAKRQAKSEAKRARQANASKAFKWTEERKAEEKLKKLETKPLKEERRFRKMLDRAERLETQARKMMKEAQLARARYAVLKAKRDEAAADSQKAVDEIMADTPDNDNYIALEPRVPAIAQEEEQPVDDVAMTNGTDASDDEEQSVDNVAMPNGTDTSGDEDQEADKKKKKKSKKSKEAKEEPLHDVTESADATEEPIPDGTSDKKKKKKSKKSKSEELETEAVEEAIIADEPTVDGAKDKKEKKKSKKSKKSKSEDAGDDEVADDDVADSETKAQKKRKREGDVDAPAADDSTTVEAAAAAEFADGPKEKKQKKSKKAKKSVGDAEANLETKDVEGQETSVDGVEQWNVHALGGGSARQDKFMRLLGAKKAGNAEASSGAAHGVSSQQINSIQHDLERQFNAGMKKKDIGGKRGLGA
ncbi:putative Small acidic protein family-domain-containing protein [Seiridium cardinale]